MSKVTVVGSGQVGSTCANLLVQKSIADVVLLDIAKGLPQGKALDIMQSAPILDFSKRILGTNDFGKMIDSDVVIITAGSARKPGISRADLLKVNAEVVKSVVQQVVEHAPCSVILVVTNPVDVISYFAYKISGFDSQRVIGASGVLDSARFAFFLSEELDMPISNIRAMVVGAHDDTMVPLVSHSTVDGKPISDLLESDVVEKLIKRTKKGGAEIVSYLKTGSAFYAPAAAVATMAEAILTDQQKTLPVSTYFAGHYGLKDIYIGFPCILGRGGIVKVADLELTPQEEEELTKSARVVQEGIAALGRLI